VDTAGAVGSIWAYGLRNSFTFAFQPGTGRMHINDVGQYKWEEISELADTGGQWGAGCGRLKSCAALGACPLACLSLGGRNPVSLHVQPSCDALIACLRVCCSAPDVGAKGANFGWPDTEGPDGVLEAGETRSMSVCIALHRVTAAHVHHAFAHTDTDTRTQTLTP
jgi:glucose/arabinose dehydrogenase